MSSTVTNLKLADQNQASRFPNLLSLPHVERTFWRGMPIYALEDPATDVYVVLKGRVKIMRSSPEGAQKIISIRYRGDIFGELALAENDTKARRSDEAVALDTTRGAGGRKAPVFVASPPGPSLLCAAEQHRRPRTPVTRAHAR